MSTVLVTGASGFVGTQIVNRLASKGHDLRLVSRPPAAKRLAEKFARATLLECEDLFAKSADDWAQSCKGVDAIIHAAWYVNPADYLDSEKNAACVSGTFRMAQGAARAGVRHFVGIGTCMEYALPSEQLDINAPTGPSTVYGGCKLATFDIVATYFRSTQVDFSWC